jgi:4-hydroxythreonine-4-phosphate dehydrogenase
MLPRLILTSGEPSGIGPDLCIEAARREFACDLIVAGDVDLLRARARALNADVRIESVARSNEPQAQAPGRLRVLHISTAQGVSAGKLDKANARYVLNLLDAAADGCVAGEYDAMVTAPVQKSVINDAGVQFSGHTEYLAERCGDVHPVMLLACGNLRVALATTHLPLHAVPAAITSELLREVIGILHADLKTKFGFAQPRILVCGLNPHAGESGHLGDEEINIIGPTLDALRGEGLDLLGPAPADTAFTPHMLNDVHAVLAMYHDQGLPVIKYAGFGNAVNVTLGLPILRTSVDHGTALDLAGTGKADAGSLFAAIELAIELCARRAQASLQR